VRKVMFSQVGHNLSAAFLKEYDFTFVCTCCHPILPGKTEHTNAQMMALAGKMDRPRSDVGCFKFTKAKFNASTIDAHYQGVKHGRHSDIHALLTKWLATIPTCVTDAVVGQGRKRQGRDPNTQLLSQCWELPPMGFGAGVP